MSVNRFKRLLAVSVASVCIAPLPIAHAESLQDVLSAAYRTNPTIRAERAQFRATEELGPQAWSGILPQISAQSSYSNVEQTQNISPLIAGPNGGEQSFTLNPLTGAVTAEQPVFAGFRNINAIRQARARIKAGGAQLVSVEQQVLLQAANAYFDVLRDQEVYEANLSNLKFLLRQKDEASLRFEVGEITRTDVAQAEARLAGARAQLAASQSQLSVSRASFQQVVGEAPGTLETDPALPDIPETEEAARNLAKLYAPQVIAAKQSEEASRRQVSIAKGVLLPSISLQTSYQYADEPSTFVESDEQFSYGAVASVPIFQGGLNYSRIREARALNDADRQRIEEAERAVTSNVTAAWQQLIAARATIASAARQVDANELALEGVRRESELGARTTLDVLNAEQEFLNARVSQANAQRDLRSATFTLLAASGILTPEAAGVVADSVGEEAEKSSK